MPITGRGSTGSSRQWRRALQRWSRGVERSRQRSRGAGAGLSVLAVTGGPGFASARLAAGYTEDLGAASAERRRSACPPCQAVRALPRVQRAARIGRSDRARPPSRRGLCASGAPRAHCNEAAARRRRACPHSRPRRAARVGGAGACTAAVRISPSYFQGQAVLSRVAAGGRGNREAREARARAWALAPDGLDPKVVELLLGAGKPK